MKKMRYEIWGKHADANVFLRAAEYIANNPDGLTSEINGCCHALRISATGSCAYSIIFESLFRPAIATGYSLYWMTTDTPGTGWTVRTYLTPKHSQERRILALLLCYEIVKEIQRKTK